MSRGPLSVYAMYVVVKMAVVAEVVSVLYHVGGKSPAHCMLIT